jgi:hypothetical protein
MVLASLESCDKNSDENQERTKGKFQIRVPLWALFFGWTIIFAGSLALAIGLVQGDAAASSLSSLGTQLRSSAINSVVLQVQNTLIEAEISLMDFSEDTELMTLMNSDPAISTTGITSLNLLNGDVFARFGSACINVPACRICGVQVGDNGIATYNYPGLLTVIDQATITEAGGPWAYVYSYALNTNYSAVISSSTYLFKDTPSASDLNNSITMYETGFGSYPTSMFWSGLILATPTPLLNGTIVAEHQSRPSNSRNSDCF